MVNRPRGADWLEMAKNISTPEGLKALIRGMTIQIDALMSEIYITRKEYGETKKELAFMHGKANHF